MFIAERFAAQKTFLFQIRASKDCFDIWGELGGERHIIDLGDYFSQ